MAGGGCRWAGGRAGQPQDLVARRKRAIEEDWRGEVEGLDLTLTFLRSKREQARRFERTGPVTLDVPVVPHQKPQLTEG
ncbi:hypothetical protein QIS99_30485 [Streptomyces sp. B-S-A8]|uniref:Recombinase n=1 Tax=Streptomyces solicavernae TaxID=3043614 RepID=A0ABT6S210_9ACTN|nr:hypothetical protein [Streptomyces sp. B-S-A8]MDI3390489.1 hypothetical protein [Streptomyces sp. B-S-A8]